MRNAAAVALGSSSYQLPPPPEQIIDHFRGFLAIPFLELSRCGGQSFPIVSAQDHRLILKSAGAELHAGIVTDGGEISDGLELGQTNLTIGWIQAADPPILQPLPGGHHLRDD